MKVPWTTRQPLYGIGVAGGQTRNLGFALICLQFFDNCWPSGGLGGNLAVGLTLVEG
jgi:hypothetical protein